jgi:hypothetical protein
MDRHPSYQRPPISYPFLLMSPNSSGSSKDSKSHPSIITENNRITVGKREKQASRQREVQDVRKERAQIPKEIVGILVSLRKCERMFSFTKEENIREKRRKNECPVQPVSTVYARAPKCCFPPLMFCVLGVLSLKRNAIPVEIDKKTPSHVKTPFP